MHPQLEVIAGGFDSALARVEVLARRLPGDAWIRRPAPDQWSPLECVAHLNLTGRAFVPLLTAALEEARRSGRPAPARYRRDPIGWLISTVVSPRPWLRSKTSASFVPAAVLPPAEVLDEFRRLQQEQLALLRDADGLAIDRVFVASPFDARARYSAYAAFIILPRHQHRHLGQAERASQPHR